MRDTPSARAISRRMIVTINYTTVFQIFSFVNIDPKTRIIMLNSPSIFGQHSLVHLCNFLNAKTTKLLRLTKNVSFNKMHLLLVLAITPNKTSIKFVKCLTKSRGKFSNMQCIIRDCRRNCLNKDKSPSPAQVLTFFQLDNLPWTLSKILLA